MAKIPDLRYQLILVQFIDECCPKAFLKASSAPVEVSTSFAKQLLRHFLEYKLSELEYSLSYELIVNASD